MRGATGGDLQRGGGSGDNSSSRTSSSNNDAVGSGALPNPPRPVSAGVGSGAAKGRQEQRTELLTMDEALAVSGVGYYQRLLFFICGSAFAADAMEVVLVSFLSSCVKAEWGLSSSAVGYLAASVFFGEVLGCLCWGPLADKFGRKPTFVASCAIITLGGSFSVIATSYTWLVIARFFAGFGIGASVIVFDLLMEFLPADKRGKQAVLLQLFWMLGSVYVTGMAWFTLTFWGWRTLTACTAVPVFFALALSTKVPESPRWLLAQRREKEAVLILQQTAHGNGNYFPPAIRLRQVSAQPMARFGSFADIFSPTMWRFSVNSVLLWTGMGFVYFGCVLMISRVFSTESDDDDDDSCSFNFTPIFVSACSEFLGCLGLVTVIESWGRVRSQQVAYIVGGLLMSLLVSDFSTWFLMIIAFCARAALMAASSGTWVITPELFPTEVRSTAHAVAAAGSKIGAAAASLLMSEASRGIYVTLVVVTCIMLAMLLHFLPETAGKRLGHDIEHKILRKDGAVAANAEKTPLIYGSDRDTRSLPLPAADTSPAETKAKDMGGLGVAASAANPSSIPLVGGPGTGDNADDDTERIVGV